MDGPPTLTVRMLKYRQTAATVELPQPRRMMSEITTIKKGPLSEGMLNEMAETSASYKTDFSVVVSTIPMKGVERTQVKEEVKCKMEPLEEVDIDLGELDKPLRVQYETFNEMPSTVGNYFSDLKELGPTKAKRVESVRVYRISEARLDPLTTLFQAKNGSILHPLDRFGTRPARIPCLGSN